MLGLTDVSTSLGHRDVSLSVRKGEIVGLYGLVGAGRTELAKSILGQSAVTGGEGPFIKAAMEATGLKAGPPRPPSVRSPEHLLAEIRELLRSSGAPHAGERAEATA